MVPSVPRRLLVLCVLGLSALPARAQEGLVGIPEPPSKVKSETDVWKDDEREKALDFQVQSRPQRALKAAPISNAGASRDRGAGAGGAPASSGPDGAAPPSKYRFTPQDMETQPTFSFIASIKDGEPPVSVTCRDGVLYAGAQRYPIQGTTRIFVKKSDGPTLRRFIARRRDELRAKLPAAPAGARAVLQQELDTLDRVRIVDLDLP